MTSSALPAPKAAEQATQSGEREERKYPLPEARADLLAAWISVRCVPDPEYPSGVISSCYYDNASLDSYWSAADGFWDKTKLRLRWYGEPVEAGSEAWLELKQRAGMRGSKLRLRLRVDDGPALSEGIRLPTREQLSRALRELGAPAAPTLEPTVLIRYQRRRWQDAVSGLRVSLDTRVRAAPPQRGLPWRAIPSGAVLELKSAGPLPPRLHGLERLKLRRAAHSKYALAVELVLPKIWRGGA